MTTTLTPVGEKLDALFNGRTSVIARDLKLNLRKYLIEAALTPAEAAPTLVALAATTGQDELLAYGEEWMQTNGDSEEQVREAREAAGMVTMLNTYYSFRQKLGDESYGAAGLRMTALARPALGKERFEMLAFAVSVINGCEQCIKAHEKVLKDHGVTADKIHDLGRLAAVVFAVTRLLKLA